MAWRMVDRDQLAELFGVHPDTVSDFTREGMPVTERGGRGVKSVFDSVACLTWWRLNKTAMNAKEVAQTRAFQATAEFNELKVAERRKLLIQIDAAIRAGQADRSAWVARIRNWPRELLLAGHVTREQEAALGTFVRELLVEIANWKTLADVEAVVKRYQESAA